MKRADLSLGLVPRPRTLVISSSSHALILRPSNPSSSLPKQHQVIVEFTPLDDGSPNGVATGIRLAPCWGSLGLLEIDREIFLVIVTHATTIGSLEPDREPINRVLSIELFCLTSAAFDSQHLGYHHTSSSTSSSPALDYEDQQSLEHPALTGIKKIVSNGQFYFSQTGVDLASRTELRLSDNRINNTEPDGDPQRFSWNSFMLVGLLRFRDGLPSQSRPTFDQHNFLISVIQGYVSSFELKLPPAPSSLTDELLLEDSISHQPITLSISLFSRLGSRRAGTRFNTRGIDDDGNVANFVETETVVSIGSTIFSYVQIRGSVPLFFEQSGTGMTNVIGGLSGQGHKINLTRNGFATQPAFRKHFEELLRHYSQIQILSLLSGSKDGEIQLTQAYTDQLKALDSDLAQMACFDLHHRAKMTGLEGVRTQLINDPAIGGRMDQFGYFLCQPGLEDTSRTPTIERQKGVFRINCLDCLDRTNVVQEMLSRIALGKFLATVHPHLSKFEYLWNCHRTLWADNGDVLSKIYAGTGALNTSFTRGGKQTFSGILSNASKSVGRMYNSNFIDKSKQANIDLLLGNLNQQKPVKVFDPVSETVKKLLHDRRSEYSSENPITIWAGTFNLNGGSPPMANNNELMKWLSPSSLNLEPDIMVVAFQEIVKLSPQQIMVTDPDKKRKWERVILASLDSRSDKKSDYVILRSDQLVGTALIILVKSDMVSAIRSVEATTKKTGLKGIAGNKGAVAIRMELHDTSFCFVTAHFAAGHSNVEERNHDYGVIANELEFLKGKKINSHDNVIWAGDFNYRIGGGLSNLIVRQAIADEDYTTLLASDQLLAHMSTQVIFPRYLEGPINFPPTYKYDIGTDRYDTSEKMRIPAWTDRILYQGNDLDLTHYSRVDLKISDHRPIYAIMIAKVRVVDRVKKESIRAEILNGSEVKAVRDKTLAPVHADIALKDQSKDVDEEWWKTAEFPDGTYMPSAEELGRISTRMSNPFDPNFMPSLNRSVGTPASESKSFHFGQRSLPTHRLSRHTISAPSSPPPTTTKMIPPAIPARPGGSSSRSPSQSRKSKTGPETGTWENCNTKKQPPPVPPPRPLSKVGLHKEFLAGSTESVVSPNHTSINQSLTNSPPPPPPRPSSKIGLHKEFMLGSNETLSPNTSISLSIPDSPPGGVRPLPPPRPISKIGLSKESTITTKEIITCSPQTMNNLYNHSSESLIVPPLPPPRPLLSKIETNKESSIDEVVNSSINTLNNLTMSESLMVPPLPPPRPSSKIETNKEGSSTTDEIALTATTSTQQTTSDNPIVPPLPPPRPISKIGSHPESLIEFNTKDNHEIDDKTKNPTRDSNNNDNNNDDRNLNWVPLPPPRPVINFKKESIKSNDDYKNSNLPPPIPPKPKPPKPTLKPKPMVIKQQNTN